MRARGLEVSGELDETARRKSNRARVAATRGDELRLHLRVHSKLHPFIREDGGRALADELVRNAHQRSHHDLVGCSPAANRFDQPVDVAAQGVELGLVQPAAKVEMRREGGVARVEDLRVRRRTVRLIGHLHHQQERVVANEPGVQPIAVTELGSTCAGVETQIGGGGDERLEPGLELLLEAAPRRSQRHLALGVPEKFREAGGAKREEGGQASAVPADQHAITPVAVTRGEGEPAGTQVRAHDAYVDVTDRRKRVAAPRRPEGQ